MPLGQLPDQHPVTARRPRRVAPRGAPAAAWPLPWATSNPSFGLWIRRSVAIWVLQELGGDRWPGPPITELGQGVQRLAPSLLDRRTQLWQAPAHCGTCRCLLGSRRPPPVSSEWDPTGRFAEALPGEAARHAIGRGVDVGDGHPTRGQHFNGLGDGRVELGVRVGHKQNSFRPTCPPVWTQKR